MIRCNFQDPYGNSITKRFNGISARIFQHEYEHMQGERFTDSLSQFALNRAREKQAKILKKVRRQLKAANQQIKRNK